MSSQFTSTRASRALVLLLCMGTLWPELVKSDPPEQLLMPGPLAEDHADLEADCTNCHQAFDRSAQRELCLECHEAAAADLKALTGMHSRNGADELPCGSCHAEHRGRDAKLSVLDAATFDHALTDFALEGKHQSTTCKACHAADVKYRDAPHDCLDCHKKEDPHRGSLGEDCASCHDARGWPRTAFDHDETEFPLLGEHQKAACSACHTDKEYTGTPTECSSCHKVDDKHGGRLGPDCKSCHTPRAWDRSTFDHDRDTEYKLVETHRSTRCEACHAVDPYKTPTKSECAACHTQDDAHKGRFAANCGQCHTTKDWKTQVFDHNKTEFPLLGLHQNLYCTSCHTGVIDKQKLESRCESCHQASDPHAGQLGKDCGRCHSPLGWKRDVSFDHGLTAFPLLGLHEVVGCEECHTTAAFQDVKQLCVDCHRAEDVHTARLGPDCSSCHNPNGWKFSRFDHAQRTGFALDGGHAGLNCTRCHTEPTDTSPKQSSECLACHSDDDVHTGSYGRNCERCHNTSDWKDALPGF